MASEKLIRVKLVNRGQTQAKPPQWIRQLPGGGPRWGCCVFTFDPQDEEYDWFVAENDLPAPDGEKQREAREVLKCAPENTLFITREPSSISTYGRRFLRQFQYVLTGQEDWAISHPGKIHSQPALRWYYGDTHGDAPESTRGFDEIAQNVPTEKTKVIGTMCSAKAQKHTMHADRLRFTEQLCDALPELDRFGQGFHRISDKADCLDAYKYHVAIENHECDHWWTEKLSDAFLGHTLPFYHGAPNAADYFPKESFIPIDIYDFPGSLKIIRDAIENGEYEKRIEAIAEARRRCLYEYQTLAVVAKIVEERYDATAKRAEGVVVHGRHSLRRNPIAAVEIGLEKVLMRTSSVVRQYLSKKLPK